MNMKKQNPAAVMLLAVGLAGSTWCYAGEPPGASAKADARETDASAKLPAAPAKPGGAAVSSLKDIQVSFKLDPRLTRGLYMGDRWVSPPTYQRVGEGKDCTVETRTSGLDASGKPWNIAPPKWISADPETVTVTPGQGNEVKITIKRAGETTVEVASQGLSKKLTIKAVAHGDAIQAQITQHPVTGSPGLEVRGGGTK